VVAQAELIPMQLGPIGTTFRPCAELFPVEDLVEGDFYINNHPFEGGQHVPDVFLFSPIFFEGRVMGFGATVAHHLDLGGGAPGLNPEARDVYQEGIIFPPSKWNMRRDWNGGPLERLVRANVRVPEQTIGDFNAQFAANGSVCGASRSCARVTARPTVTEAMSSLLDYSERRMRAAIATVPDGVYEGEAIIDDDGLGKEPPASASHGDHRRRPGARGLCRYRIPDADQHQLPVRVDDCGDALLCQNPCCRARTFPSTKGASAPSR
jgi:N-methylhydantoinase B